MGFLTGWLSRRVSGVKAAIATEVRHAKGVIDLKIRCEAWKYHNQPNFAYRKGAPELRQVVLSGADGVEIVDDAGRIWIMSYKNNHQVKASAPPAVAGRIAEGNKLVPAS